VAASTDVSVRGRALWRPSPALATLGRCRHGTTTDWEAAADASEQIRVRFAPSPTGGLHIGSARTALYNYLFARRHGGRFVLRVEDTDVVRSERRHEASIVSDLRWLGLEWDEGPDTGGPYGPYRQSERSDRYARVAAELLAAGAAYPCFCSPERLEASRREQLDAGGTPVYDGRCAGIRREVVRERLDRGETAAVRLRLAGRALVVDDLIRGPVDVAPETLGDFIIVRSDGSAAYNFAAAVDDHDMEISHVIRGEDHLVNTARQLAVLRALAAPSPRYAHLSLVLGPDGSKLSKRHGATTIGEFRELGYLPQALVDYLALLSWAHGEEEVHSLGDLVAAFDLADLSASPAVFDVAKLDWLDRQHIARLAEGEHRRLVAARLPEGTPLQAVAPLAMALRSSISRYSEVPAAAASILTPPERHDDAIAMLRPAGDALTAFADLRATTRQWLDRDDASELLGCYRTWAKEHGVRVRDALMPLRQALTGREHGPELPLVVAAIDRGDALDRLARVGVRPSVR